jgi:hypothetical protein
MAEGGLEALTEKQRAAAGQSYAAWAEAKPDLALKYDLANYVGYVQSHWAQEKRLTPLDRLAQQMGRTEERRAASGFVQGPMPTPSQDNAADRRERRNETPSNDPSDYIETLLRRIEAADKDSTRDAPEPPERNALIRGRGRSSGRDR